MPAWTQRGLLAAGRYVATKLRESSDTEEKSLFGDDKLLEHVEQFGEITRCVFRARATKLLEFHQKQAKAFKNVSFSISTRTGHDIDADEAGGKISYFLLHYSTLDYIHFVLRYPSRYTELRVREKATQLSFIGAVQSLWETINGRIPERGGPVLEVETFGMIERKVSNWQVRFLPSTKVLELHPPPKVSPRP